MSNFLDAVGQIVRSRVCNLLNNPLVDGRNWGPEPPFVGDGVATNPLTKNWYNNTISGMQGIFCDAPVADDDKLPPPFEGGQCDAQVYVVVASWLNDTTGVRQTFNSTVFGPAGGVRISNPTGSTNILEINCRGRRPASSCDAPPTTLTSQQWFSVANSAGLRSGASIDSVSPCGFVDNCGDPPSTYTPTNVFNFTQNVEYTDNSNNTYNELGDFNLFAPVFLPGSIQIPFSLNLGGVNFNGTFFPNGTINLTPTLDVEIGTPGDPAPVDDIELPDDEEYDIEPSEEQQAQIVGAWVIITTDSPRATRVFENGVTHFYPRNGILKFRIAAGTRGFVYSEGIDIKTRRAFIPVPRAGRAIGADFFPYQGSAGEVTLAYARVPEGLIPIPE